MTTRPTGRYSVSVHDLGDGRASVTLLSGRRELLTAHVPVTVYDQASRQIVADLADVARAAVSSALQGELWAQALRHSGEDAELAAKRLTEIGLTQPAIDRVVDATVARLAESVLARIPGYARVR